MFNLFKKGVNEFLDEVECHFYKLILKSYFYKIIEYKIKNELKK